MIENFPKNGNFMDRRKLFVQFPFHSMNHQLPFNWSGQEDLTHEKRRIKRRQEGEHQYIQKVYDQKMDMKLRGKFKDKVDTFRVIPNEITKRREQDSLAQQVEEFDTSKVIPRTNPESPQSHEELNTPLQRSGQYQHQSAVEMSQRPNQPRYQPQYEPQQNYELPGYQSRVTNQSGLDQRDQNHERRLSPEQYNQLYRLPYAANNHYTPSKVSNQRKYANLSDSHQISIDHPYRNYQPDQLQGFLREAPRAQRRRPQQASLSKDRMRI